MIQQKERRPTVLLAVLVALGGLAFLLVLGTPLLLIAVQAAREAAEREKAENALAQLRLALENYHQRVADSASTQPAAAVPQSEDGKVPKASAEAPTGEQVPGESTVEAAEGGPSQHEDEDPH
ncbi:MAG: hypothetical protein GXX96_31790 [Planctomycetaceae bacterium]|nr:hypothetical protein [Planctomycetaceae bacterium]